MSLSIIVYQQPFKSQEKQLGRALRKQVKSSKGHGGQEEEDNTSSAT
jgi:hypothetical protein